jgi:hypothetical protein
MSKEGSRNQQPQSLWNLPKHTLVGLSALSITVTLTAAATGLIRESRAVAADLPIVKSAVLGANLNVPWSRPVKVTDPFEGNYLAVFDRHYFYRRVLNDRTRTYVVSLWSPKSVRFLLTDSNYGCYSGYHFYPTFTGPNCVNNSITEAVELFIKVGEQVFRLEGKNSVFEVSDELATALENSPIGNVDIRLVTRSGETVNSEIGKGTVEAWKAIY